MKLLLNDTSPYARMVRVAVLEKNLQNRVEIVQSDPWGKDDTLLENNAVGRVPTLVLDSGIAISESLLIVQYLEALSKDNSLLPQNRIEEVLHLAGLGHGLMDAAFLTVVSRKYLNQEANESLLNRLRLDAIERSIEYLETVIADYSESEHITAGDIAIAVALNYIRFRLPELYGVDGTSLLEAWRREISKRESFRLTAFPEN